MAGLAKYVDSVNSELARLSFDESTLAGAVSDSLSNGGKRVRAVLALLWCEVFSGSYEAAIPMAVAYELAHSAALVEDDVIDQSDTRRGNESIVHKYGLSNAILASNMLLFNVPKMVSRYRDMESERLCRLFDLVGECCRATTMGEFLDLQMAQREDVSEDEYEKMIRLKTAALLAAPSASGAIVGGASDGEVDTAYRFGELLGMAYQIRDDLLDIIGDEKVLGKPVFTDVKGGKKSIVLVHALSKCSDGERGYIKSLFNKGHISGDEIKRVKGIVFKYGSADYCEKKASRCVESARKLLEPIRPCEARTALLDICDFVSERYY
jgi:geranylgeranyl pyrophosphate synthase